MKTSKPFFSKKQTKETQKKDISHSKKAFKKFGKAVQAGWTKIYRIVWLVVGILVMFLVGVAFFAPIVKTTKKLDYFDYVSELRSNILLASNENYSLRVFAVEKEYPYAADGVRRETSNRAEIYLTAQSGDKVCSIEFVFDKKSYGGEMSYDNVKSEYFYSLSLDLSKVETLDFTINYGGEKFVLNAVTVKKENTLSPRDVLTKLQENEKTTFDTLTNENGFIGEIYLRLISEDEPYYYIGLIGKDGKIRAYLLTADTGKVLAKRES